ncbi:unnamed protein product [marine sediment metagenome]|uniref:Ferritin/DPS domain-containing protein n=1 Tax=marine sediment metagenome TaxID=412755 RepID=X1KMJ7_9ZZZZ
MLNSWIATTNYVLSEPASLTVPINCPIFVGNTLKEMAQRNIQDEANAINLYKQIIEAALKEGDVTTSFLFKQILQQEEDHHDTFTTLLEDL